MSIRRLKLTGRILGKSVTFTNAATKFPDAGPGWIQIATAGEYKGYSAGPVTFDAVFFRKLIDNFHDHPWYTPDPTTGIGMRRVVPYDYEHASEMDPTSGTIPQKGAPAPAWALDLEMRTGPDNVAQLWALTDPVNQEVREQLQTGAYASTSVAIWKDAVDGVTGEKIGPVLTSVAFTNHPFIEGMQQIAASRIAARVEVWGEAESPEELIVGLRDILDLEENADVATIGAELAKLALAFQEGRTGPAFPEGVGCILDRVRQLCSLPILASAQEIVAAAGQALGVVSGSPSQTPPGPENNDMSGNAFASKVAAIFKLRPEASEESILAAAQATDETAKTASGALEKLQAMFGSSDVQSLLSDASKAIELADQSRDTVAALTEAQKRLAGYDKQDAEAEVDAVAATLGITGPALKRLRPIMLTDRLKAGESEEALAQWRKENPIPPAQARILSSRVLAGSRGEQLTTRLTASGGRGEEIETSEELDTDADHPMRSYPGRNETEKAVNYLTEKRPGFSKLEKRAQLFQASQYLAKGAPVIGSH